MIFPYKGLLLFSLSVLILIGTIIFALRQVSQLKSGLVLVEHTNSIVNELETVVLNVSESESICLGYLLTDNENLIHKYNTTLELINTEIQSLSLLIDKEIIHRKKFNEISNLINQKINIQAEAISLKENKKLSSAELIAKFNIGRLYLERIKFLKDDIKSNEEILIEERQKTSNNNIKGTVYSILISFIATFLVGIFLVGFIFKYINAEKKLKANLLELNENKNKFFSIISHDLRGPVSNVVSLTELLQTSTSAEEKNKFVSMIQVSIKKVNDLLGNLLKWTSIQMNTIQIVPELLYVSKIVDENIRLLAELANNKNIFLINEVTPETTVWADYEMISTVLRNLISNSIKFTNRGGQITISSSCKNNITEVSIKDNGIGMSKETFENLFKKDIHVTTRGTANESGSGLGLQICKEFIERNDGKLTVESKLNKGSIFKFTLNSHHPSQDKGLY